MICLRALSGGNSAAPLLHDRAERKEATTRTVRGVRNPAALRLKEVVVAIGEIVTTSVGLEDNTIVCSGLAQGCNSVMVSHSAPRQAPERALDCRRARAWMDPTFVFIDHTTRDGADVLDRGFWAASLVYPHTKMATSHVESWHMARAPYFATGLRLGRSAPLAFPKTAELCSALESRKRHSPGPYENPCARRQERPNLRCDWLNPAPIDPHRLHGQPRPARRPAPRVICRER